MNTKMFEQWKTGKLLAIIRGVNFLSAFSLKCQSDIRLSAHCCAFSPGVVGHFSLSVGIIAFRIAFLDSW